MVVKMNMGQMLEDVRLAVNGKTGVAFYGRLGGAILAVEDIAAAIRGRAQDEPKLIRPHAPLKRIRRTGGRT